MGGGQGGGRGPVGHDGYCWEKLVGFWRVDMADSYVEFNCSVQRKKR